MGVVPARIHYHAVGICVLVTTLQLCATDSGRSRTTRQHAEAGVVRKPLQRAAAGRSQATSIPKILHQVLMTPGPGEPSPKANLTAYTAKWRERCQEVFSDWEYHLWDNDAAEKLLQTKFPDFLDTWESYDMVVLRGDAIRPFIMQAYGGLYLDADVECYRPADEWLDGYSLVFQAEQNEGAEHLNNGAMASTKGHPFWKAVIDGMQERAYIFDVGANYAPVKEGDWETNILWRVGPLLLRETFAEFKKAMSAEAWSQRDRSRPPGGHKSPLTHARRRYKVWPVGEFYFPCNWKNLKYCYEVDDMKEKPAELAGRHWFSGTWRETNSNMNQAQS